jgi:alpha-ketoglutarate-dependent 2,4-dichlorophenoxyacetate dioxygenase
MSIRPVEELPVVEMSLTFEKIQAPLGAIVQGVTLSGLRDETAFDQIRKGMDQYAVLVFRDQPMSAAEQMEFARKLDGELHTMTTLNVMADSRGQGSGITEISNASEQGGVLAADDRRRMSALGNRLWHTDASFVDPAGRYSMLSARVVPPVDADTEFADMRTAYDALDVDMRRQIESLRVHHSIVYSRGLLGFEFKPEERAKLAGAVHPLVRSIPRSGRKSLYLASHASHIVDMPVAEGRLLLAQLTEHATQKPFVYSHAWRPNDFVIWDNRATMHRAQVFDDQRFTRELRRTTTLDMPAAV